MPSFMRTKEDIEYHSDGFRPRRPAVNVKVYDSLANGYAKWKEEAGSWMDPRFTLEWIDHELGDDLGNDIFWSCCEMRWEDLEMDAQEIWGSPTIQVYSEGRSGGWAIVEGINLDVDSWDAIDFGKWKRFAKFARGTADYIMVDVVDRIYDDYFLPWAEEQSELMAPAIPEGFA